MFDVPIKLKAQLVAVPIAAPFVRIASYITVSLAPPDCRVESHRVDLHRIQPWHSLKPDAKKDIVEEEEGD